MSYGLLGTFLAQPGRRDDLVEILLEAAAALGRDDGCLHYVISTTEDPDTVWVTEVWTDRAAHDASLEPEDVKALIQRAMPLIAGMGEQTHLTVHGGKGL